MEQTDRCSSGPVDWRNRVLRGRCLWTPPGPWGSNGKWASLGAAGLPGSANRQDRANAGFLCVPDTSIHSSLCSLAFVYLCFSVLVF